MHSPADLTWPELRTMALTCVAWGFVGALWGRLFGPPGLPVLGLLWVGYTVWYIRRERRAQ